MVSAAIRHPIRVRVLELLSVREEISATAFVHQGLGREIVQLKAITPREQVNAVFYHLKQLEDAGAVSETRSVPRRGGTERFFRANAVAYFSDEEWAETELGRRREISRVVAQGLLVQIEGAIMAGTFDSRTNRWLLWEPKDLDEQGWAKWRPRSVPSTPKRGTSSRVRRSD